VKVVFPVLSVLEVEPATGVIGENCPGEAAALESFARTDGKRGVNSAAILFDVVLHAQEDRHAAIPLISTVHLAHGLRIGKSGHFSNLSPFHTVLL
jgi:hypothetical protein